MPPVTTQTNGYVQIGRRQRRADSPERLTGRTRFANDLLPPGALYTRFVRSPYASATIVSVDSSAAKGVPGVVAVLTARDLPIPNAESASEARDILLAFDRVMYVGQPVVAVLAETDAPLTWGKETSPFDRFKAKALPPGAARSPDDWAPVVELPGAPQGTPERSTPSAAREYAAAAGQTAWRRALAPRHQSAVKKYFAK